MFEEALRDHAKVNRGVFLDNELYDAYYRAFFYSGLYTEGSFYKDRLSSVEATTQFASDLADFKSGIPAEFKRWYTHLALFKKGSKSIPLLQQDLEQLKTLGYSPLFDILWTLSHVIDSVNPRWRPSLKAINKRLDSRPEIRGRYSWYIHQKLLDLKLTEKLCKNIARNGNLVADYSGVCTRLLDDKDELRKVIHDSTIPVQDRADAFYNFQFIDDVSPEEILSEFKKLLLEEPDNWKIRSEYVMYLKWKKRYKDAAEVILDWLKTHSSSEGFDYINAHANLGEIYYKDKKYLKAWEAVEPVVSSWQQYSMQQGAFIRDALGDKEGALQLARAAAERYPDGIDSTSDLMQIMWNNSMNREAVSVLESYRYKLRAKDWCDTIATKFAKVFKDRPLEDTLSAFNDLTSSKRIEKQYIGCIPWRISFYGKNEAAYKMLLEKNNNKFTEWGDLTNAYSQLELYKGEKEAAQWLNSQAYPRKEAFFSVVAYRERAYGILWNVISPSQTNNPTLVWLMRATHLLTEKGKNDNRWKMLRDYYASAEAEKYVKEHPQTRASFEIGRYLVDLTSIQQALSAIKDQKTFIKAAYFLGCKASANLKFEEAADWYNLAEEIRQDTTIDDVMAHDVLDGWRENERSLAHQKKLWIMRLEGKQEIDD